MLLLLLKDDKITIERNGNGEDITVKIKSKSVKIEGELELNNGVAINNFVSELNNELQNGDEVTVPTSQAVKNYIEELLRKPDKLIEEDLGDGVKLEMVLIPAGTFLMGSPETEPGSNDRERPQHFVSVPAFYMSKFQVTQAQWKAIASLEGLKVEHDLEPDPSRFKMDSIE